MKVTHTVKSETPHFDAVVAGTKTAELLWDDRSYAVGDLLRQREVDLGEYTGRVIVHEITHKLTGGPWLAPGYCMLSLSREPVEWLHIDNSE